MAFDYEIDLDTGLLLGRVWGRWTIEDVREFRERVMSDPNFSADLHQLVDLTDVTNIDVEVRQAIDFGKSTPFGTRGLRAYVAPSDSVYGTLNAYLVFADEEGATSRLFRSMDEARAWLGLT